MKAIIYRDFGPPDILKCEEIAKPVPKDDEVLIKVRAASLNPLDWRLMRGGPLFFRMLMRLRQAKIKRAGVDVSGEVEEVGRNVRRFKSGDAVFGFGEGALAEYACSPESKLAAKPDNVNFEDAASANVAGLTALQALRDKGRLQVGQQVLINGAAGGVGTFAVQIAKSFGARVIGVCGTRNVEMVRSLGADHVIDYTQEDFAKGTERYDLILDCVGNHTLSELRRILNPNGICVIIGAQKLFTALARAAVAPILSCLLSQKFLFFIAKVKEQDLTTLGNLMAAGKLKPVIDRRYKLSAASDALRYLEQGHASGKVVITLGG